MYRIKLQGISKHFGDIQALNRINLEIKEGEIFGLLGTNESGKSTLLNIIADRIKPDCGKISAFNEDNQEILGIESISYLPEEKLKEADLTVREIISLKKQEVMMETSELSKDVKKYLKSFNMLDKIDSNISDLSDGMKRKLSICLALLPKNKILLLDNPTLDLDTFSRKILSKMMIKLKKQKIIIIATQNLEFAEICDRIAILDKGELIFNGKINELIKLAQLETFISISLDKPVSKYELLSLKNITMVKVKDNYVKIILDDFIQGSEQLMNYINNKGLIIKKYEVIEPSLENAFLKFLKSTNH